MTMIVILLFDIYSECFDQCSYVFHERTNCVIELWLPEVGLDFEHE